jgi:putative FmdB family regulatory protein
MPTYEYECKKCGHRFEVFQSMSDEPIKKCPECGKQVRRLVSGGAGVIFKGSGFYVTDKQEKAPTKPAAEKKKEGKEEKKEEKAPTNLAAEKKEDKTVTSNVSKAAMPPPQPTTTSTK